MLVCQRVVITFPLLNKKQGHFWVNQEAHACLPFKGQTGYFPPGRAAKASLCAVGGQYTRLSESRLLRSRNGFLLVENETVLSKYVIVS